VGDGAEVVLSARRADRLAEAVAEAGGGHAVAGDACADGDCDRVADEAVALVGPLDLVVYAAGSAPLRALADTDAAAWRQVLATNVVGANQLVRAVVPRMAPAGIVAVLSSEAAHTPRYGLGAYGASKAALEASLRSWRNERPDVRFCSVVVGQTYPTEFGDGFEADELTAAFEHWGRHGLLQTAFMTPDGVAGTLRATLGTALAHPDVNVDELVLRSPSDVVGSPSPSSAPAVVRRSGEAPPDPSPPWVVGS
jgi:NAD(P)-dependent dehydrogenase (short-subunit alcohol dehydrogenase family)